MRASDLLRKAGIDTEIILQFIQPEQLPYGNDLVEIEEFKRRILDHAYRNPPQNPEENEPENLPRIPAAKIPDLADFLSEMNFFITVRGLQTAERLSDINEAITEDDLRKMMTRVFRFVNQRNKKQALEEGSPATFYFLYEDDEDAPLNWRKLNKQTISRYFTEYFATNIGRNFGEMHKLGLLHCFPHKGNLSAAGGIYDLDSIKGEKLGLKDAEIDPDSFIREANNVLDREIIPSLRTAASKDYISFGINEEIDLRINFIRSYLTAREMPTDNITKIGMLFSMLDAYTFSEFYDQVLKALEEHLEVKVDELRDPETFADTANLVFISVGIATTSRIYEAVVHRDLIDLGIKSDEERIEFGKRTIELFKKMGWEENILEHISDIFLFFTNFSEINDRNAREYYYDLLIKELGWEIKIEDPSNTLTQLYAQKRLKDLEELIQMNLISSSGEISRTDVVRNSLKQHQEQLDFFSTGFMNFTFDWVKEQLQTTYATDYDEIISKHGEETGEVIKALTEDRITDEIDLEDDHAEELGSKLAAEEELLAQRYIDNEIVFDLIPHIEFLNSMVDGLNFNDLNSPESRYIDGIFIELGIDYQYEIDLPERLKKMKASIRSRVIDIYTSQPQDMPKDQKINKSLEDGFIGSTDGTYMVYFFFDILSEVEQILKERTDLNKYSNDQLMLLGDWITRFIYQRFTSKLSAENHALIKTEFENQVSNLRKELDAK